MIDYNGYLNIYKEKGMTSHDVVFKCRKILKTKKIGHTGTLDPNAEGVLVLCVGKATKMVEYIMEHQKVYEAQIIFGKETDTCDITGKTLNEKKMMVTQKNFLAQLEKFVGPIMQKPPIYSALKINGKKLYHYARNGEDVEIPERPVRIDKILPIEFSEENQSAKIIVECSKGTYIRSLCRDIGYALNTFACMGELTRLKVGDFSIDHGVKLSKLQEMVGLEKEEHLFYDLEFSMDHYGIVRANEQGKKFLGNGNKLYQWNAIESFDHYMPDEILRLYIDDKLIGMGKYCFDLETPYVKPLKLL